MCKFITITPDRKEIISQFPIADRDNHIYTNIEEAVEDALRRAFKDINFRTMTATRKNKSIKKILEQINGSRKIDKFDINTVEDTKKPLIQTLIDRLKSKTLRYEDCKITEYLIICLTNSYFVQRFVDYFNCHTYMDEIAFDEWHNKTCTMFLNVLKEYYKKPHYGKSQKIVNMMFKHLYCINFGKKDDWKLLDENYFTYCHMPLDSFTLDWLHRKDNIAVCEWSNLDYNTPKSSSQKASTNYIDYLKRVRAQFPFNSLTAFQGEFYIWPQIQLTQAIETIYRLNHNKSDVGPFVSNSLTDKCTTIASELSGKSFAKIFI